MKCSKIISILVLLAVLFTSFYPNNISFAAEDDTADGNYQIQKYSSVENLKVKKKGSAYTIAFQHKEADIELTAEFYGLEGAALYDGKAIGNVLASNLDVLYLSISENKGLLDSTEREAESNELFLRIVLLDTDTNQISDIRLFLKKSQYSALKKALKNRTLIDTDHELYGPLWYSGLWIKSYLAENQAVPQEFIWEEEITSDARLPFEYSEISAYINTAAFVTPANAYGYGNWREFGGEPASFYIRDTFSTGDSYVTLLALFRIRTTQVSGADGFYSVHFEVERQGDYFIEISGGKVTTVKEASPNMAYLVTKDPSMGIELAEGFSTGSIDICGTSGNCLGSAGTETGGFWKKVASFFYPVVSTFGSISDFFGGIIRAITGTKQQAAEPNPYKLSVKYTPAANPNAYSVTCGNNMYKRTSSLKTEMYLKDHDASEELRVHYRFGLMVVGFGYRHNMIENGSIETNFVK